MPVTRREVAVAGHQGDAPTARHGLASDDPAVRATALTALLRCGAITADELRRAATDESPVVRRRVAEVVPLVPEAERVPLVPLLADLDESVAETAAWALGELSPPEPGAVGRLSELATGHEDALVREAAVAALGALGDRAGLEAILAAASDKPAVRRRAVLALAPFDGPEVDAAIARALEDRDWQVRHNAELLR